MVRADGDGRRFERGFREFGKERIRESGGEENGDLHSRIAMNMYPYICDVIQSKEVLLKWHPQPGQESLLVPLLKDMFASERRKAKLLNFFPLCMGIRLLSFHVIGRFRLMKQYKRLLDIMEVNKCYRGKKHVNVVLLGQLVAKALHDERVLDIPFSKAFYKLILGQEFTVYVIQSFDAGFGKALIEFQAVVEIKEF